MASVFSMRLPLKDSPMMNTYANMRTKSRQGLRRRIDDVILGLLKAWPSAHMGVRRKVTGKMVKGKLRKTTTVTGGHRRMVRVTRHSSSEPDESANLTPDTAGGKMAIDCLVRAGIIRADDRKWLAREAFWQRCERGKGYVVVEVFDAA